MVENPCGETEPHVMKEKEPPVAQKETSVQVS